jgi:hypothetical protein
VPERHDITIYLRAEARAALDELKERWGPDISKQEVIVRALLAARKAESDGSQ